MEIFLNPLRKLICILVLKIVLVNLIHQVLTNMNIKHEGTDKNNSAMGEPSEYLLM